MNDLDRSLGRVEGKLDSIMDQLSEIKHTAEERTKALHLRVDKHSDRIDKVEKDHQNIRKDMKWVTIIFIGLVSGIKFIVAKMKLFFIH